MKKLTIIAILVITVGFLIFLFFRLKSETYEQISFHSQKWLISSNEERFLMYRNLLDSNILINKTEKEIETLLGKPNSITKDEDVYSWYYDLGYQDSAALMFPYNHWLYVIFDEDKKVRNAYVINRN